MQGARCDYLSCGGVCHTQVKVSEMNLAKCVTVIVRIGVEFKILIYAT